MGEDEILFRHTLVIICWNILALGMQHGEQQCKLDYICSVYAAWRVKIYVRIESKYYYGVIGKYYCGVIDKYYWGGTIKSSIKIGVHVT